MQQDRIATRQRSCMRSPGYMHGSPGRDSSPWRPVAGPGMSSSQSVPSHASIAKAERQCAGMTANRQFVAAVHGSSAWQQCMAVQAVHKSAVVRSSSVRAQLVRACAARPCVRSSAVRAQLSSAVRAQLSSAVRVQLGCACTVSSPCLRSSDRPCVHSSTGVFRFSASVAGHGRRGRIRCGVRNDQLHGVCHTKESPGRLARSIRAICELIGCVPTAGSALALNAQATCASLRRRRLNGEKQRRHSKGRVKRDKKEIFSKAAKAWIVRAADLVPTKEHPRTVYHYFLHRRPVRRARDRAERLPSSAPPPRTPCLALFDSFAARLDASWRTPLRAAAREPSSKAGRKMYGTRARAPDVEAAAADSSSDDERSAASTLMSPLMRLLLSCLLSPQTRDGDPQAPRGMTMSSRHAVREWCAKQRTPRDGSAPPIAAAVALPAPGRISRGGENSGSYDGVRDSGGSFVGPLPYPHVQEGSMLGRSIAAVHTQHKVRSWNLVAPPAALPQHTDANRGKHAHTVAGAAAVAREALASGSSDTSSRRSSCQTQTSAQLKAHATANSSDCADANADGRHFRQPRWPCATNGFATSSRGDSGPRRRSGDNRRVSCGDLPRLAASGLLGSALPLGEPKSASVVAAGGGTCDAAAAPRWRPSSVEMLRRREFASRLAATASRLSPAAQQSMLRCAQEELDPDGRWRRKGYGAPLASGFSESAGSRGSSTQAAPAERAPYRRSVQEELATF
eukprot:365832-Chlamydomonas_euryale.AAC.9